jgi:signal transduction histidine kinase
MLDTIQHLMEGVKHISNTIAHNLKTPLGLIRGRLEIATLQHQNPGQMLDKAKLANEEIDKLIVILEKLLQLAESESGAKRQPFVAVDIGEILINLTELYDAAAEQQEAKIILLVDGTVSALGDKDLIATMLANLFDNALKYAGNRAIIQVQAYLNENTVVVVVEDDGPGIPQSEQMKVLEPFYRLNRTTDGTGLGLSIVSAITLLHHGRLTLSSAMPGLRVTITLPAAGSPTLQNGNLQVTT